MTRLDASYQPKDDLRHRSVLGGKMRDSLFWELIMPDEKLGLQIYLYLSDIGKVGYNVSVWGANEAPVALKLESGTVEADVDFDNFSFKELQFHQPLGQQRVDLSFRSDELKIDFNFEALHPPFSYHSNPDGLPAWFAINRFEQTGHVNGFIEIGDRRITWDRIGHRDHSWGPRNWGIPHHWKWFIAYTPSGRAVNGWIWIARGEWGFGGYVFDGKEVIPVATIKQRADYNPDMTQRRLDAEVIDITGRSTHLVLESFGVVKLPTSDKMETEIREAACIALIDGEEGAGQFETHWPKRYLDYLIENPV